MIKCLYVSWLVRLRIWVKVRVRVRVRVRVKVRVGVQGRNRIPITTPNTSPSHFVGHHPRHPVGRRVAGRGGVFAAADSGSRCHHQRGHRPGYRLGSGHRLGSGYRLLYCCRLHSRLSRLVKEIVR